MSQSSIIKDSDNILVNNRPKIEVTHAHISQHSNATEHNSSTTSATPSQNSSEPSIKRVFHNLLSLSQSAQRKKDAPSIRPADVNSALILWLIALLGNCIGLLVTIIDGSLQTQLNQTMPMQIPPGLTSREIAKIYTTSGYIALIFLTIMTTLLIWKYANGMKACYLLLTAGGFFTILQAVGVFFAQESAWKAIAAIIAGIATFGAILCGRTNDSMQYFGFKQGNNGKS